jgi:hypothetical protein
MQSSTGQYSTQAGEPAQPVQHSVITANSFGFFFRGVNIPLDLGSNLNSSGTIPAGFTGSTSAGMPVSIPYLLGIFIGHRFVVSFWFRSFCGQRLRRF